MTDRNKLKDRARDELFSHINRCGVLQAEEEDQRQWMEETMDYLGERYPDLAESDLQELFQLGMRFCRPAIPHGRPGSGSQGAGEGAATEPESADSDTVSEGVRSDDSAGDEPDAREAVGAGAGDTAST